ncbi:hypothetical protein [Sulfuriferula nivalis]|uniref:GAF domain-containing protein n=1 Tax=Sulfuriferula nivalis TaxID=2675298 RepID=A0A809S2M9_9PROT|nr:hypothetical protein [Sulfuriferula nivalis]BBP00928.1 hypothetical protein SFSGTM_16360 [Sulfuriferula nivalis]
MLTSPSLAELENCIGLAFIWKNEHYTVVEIIDCPPTLIAQKCTKDQVMQNDVYGRAHREVRTTISIPIFNADTTQLHPEFSLIQFR